MVLIDLKVELDNISNTFRITLKTDVLLALKGEW